MTYHPNHLSDSNLHFNQRTSPQASLKYIFGHPSYSGLPGNGAAHKFDAIISAILEDELAFKTKDETHD